MASPFRPPWKPLQQASLYVGDLSPVVTEIDLFTKFSVIGPILSLRLCRCLRTGKSLCYAYVNFYSHLDALKALAWLNHKDLKGNLMRIMWSQRDPYSRKIGHANLFVKNLDQSISSTFLEGLFCQFGTILSCKIAEENGKSKGYGFVQFDSEKSAMAAMTALHDTMLEGRKLYVSKFVRKTERRTAGEQKFTNLYVKNLLDDMTEDRLQEMFSKYGKVCSVVIMKDDKGVSRGFGFVSFQSPDDAKAALEAMNGVQLGSKNLFVGRAQKKAERIKLLKQKYKDAFNCRSEKVKASNLYVKNLSDSIDDKRLLEIFGQFGRITSARVMRLGNGSSKGFGFVCFSSPEEAMNALHGLNGTCFEGKLLYVAIAQRKEDRCKELQSHYMQNTAVQSSYQSSCNGSIPRFHPFYFNFPPCPPVSPLLCQPSLYKQCATSVGTPYPFTTTVEQKTFTYDQLKHMYPSLAAGIRRDCMYRQHSMAGNSNARIRELDHVKSGSKKVGFRKTGNHWCEPVAATQSVSAATSPGNYENNENTTHPFVENLKTAPKASGVLVEMDSDALKRLNSQNSLAVKDKPIQGMKEANVKIGTNAAANFSKLKSGRCLRY